MKVDPMEMLIELPGGARVDAQFGPYLVQTDQPVECGGEGSAPTPFSLFLASIGTCAGVYVSDFCRQRGLPTDNVRIIERIEKNHEIGVISKIALDIQLPPNFPDKYREAVIRAADQCAVMKAIENPPIFEVAATVVPIA